MGRPRGGQRLKNRQRERQLDRRVQAALDAARAARRELDARIAAEAASTSVQPAPIVLEIRPEAEAQAWLDAHPMVQPTTEEFVAEVERLIPEMRERFRSLAEADPGRWHAGTGTWTLEDARQLLEDGYQLAQVTRKTGWGAGWFQDDFTFEGGYAV